MNLFRSCFPFILKPKTIDEDEIYTPSAELLRENLCRELLPYKSTLLNLILYQSNGAKLLLTNVPDNITGLALKKLFIEYSILKNHLIFFATSTKTLLKKYVLIYTRYNNLISEKCSLKESGVCNNDEFLLIWRPRKHRRRAYQHEEEIYLAPKQDEIDQATRNMTLITSEEPMYFSREFHAFGVLEAFRSLILCSARLSAFIIGCGPQAEHLIETLTNQLSYQAKIEENVVQSLVDMGFERSLVVVAVDRNNLEFSEALRWLIEQDSAASKPPSASDCSIITTLPETSRITISEMEKVRNIQSLLKIIEIHCRKKESPKREDILYLTSMGFERHQVLCALRTMQNSVPGAIEWLCGDREAAILQIKQGLPADTEIVKYLLRRSQYQVGLSSPKMFMAFLSILDKNTTVKPWNFNEDVSASIVSFIKAFNREKGIGRTNDGLIYILVNVFSENASNL